MADFVVGMSNADYHAHPAVGSSGLKLLERSPAHYWAAYRDASRARKEPTPLMKVGTAYHCAVFEPEEFGARYVEVPEGLDRRTKEGKALFVEIEASGREPLTADGLRQIMAMATASRAHPAMRVILDQPDAVGEASIFWRDVASGVECKIRPDFMVPPCAMFPSGIIIDGKSTDDAGAEGFARSSWNAEHYLQAALYSEGFMACWKTDMPPVFAWLVQERDAPYACAMYSAAPDLVEYGRKKMRPLLARLAECERTGKWPGYPTEVRPLALPVWAERAVAEGVAA